MTRMTAGDFPPDLLAVYDGYVHGRISKREFLDRAARFTVAGLSAAALPFLAFHTAGHLHTADAVRQKHPGLATIRFPQPDPDGLWRFPTFSYRRRLARLSPRTTPSGSPA